MLEAWLALLGFQLLGEAIAHLLHLPVPGPVIGMLALFGALRLRPQAIPRLRGAAEGLHAHLALLFVPAGVGVVMFLPQLAKEWLPIVVSLVVSTAVGILVTAWVARRLAGDAHDEASEHSDDA